MPLTNQELEQLADHLLNADLKDKRKNKSRLSEYPILSESQYNRRCSMEIPYSSLSNKQRLDARIKGFDYFPKEVE